MKPETAGRLAWAAPVITAGCVAAFAALIPEEQRDGAEWAFGLAFMAYALVGALIVSRHPRNPVGWLFCLIGATSAGHEALYAYASRSGRAPGEQAAAWLVAWMTEPSTAAIVLLLLLFPTGRFLSPRWRRVGWTAVAAALVWAAALAFDPGPLRSVKTIDNPLGLDTLDGLLGVLVNAGPPVFLVLVGAGLAGVVVRFRGAKAQERRQIKWLALAAGYGAASLLALMLLFLLVETDEGFGDVLTALLFAAALASFPVAAGVAILRHRLYDIDLVISRALVYGALTATLAVAYLGSVLLLQLVLNPSSDLAVAASTLAVAALFRPARLRIQSAVDRSFYRRRYDAARTLEAFGSRLRDQVDLDALSGDLRRVVGETVQPAHVSLWLRERPR
jgi:hypothetical protein